MPQRHRPPVIPEIAKAYENDPRTKLARLAVQTGTSTAPVAEGKYAYADGAARALQAVLGAYMDKKAMEGYAGDEADLLALRKQRGVDGLSGASATSLPAPTPQAAPAPPQAAAAATALGAPPPPPQPLAAPTAPPAIPNAPIPATGGGRGRNVPFGSSAPTGANWNDPPVMEEVPDAPAPVARPNAPTAVGPTRSKLLDTAYRIMSDANPYESAQGQELQTQGLAEQDRMNESAAEREQRLRDMGYQADLGVYSDAQSQDRGARYQERHDAQGRNFQAGENFKERGFRADESAKDRSFRAWEARFSASTQFALQKSSQSFQAGEAVKDRAHQLRLKGIGDADAVRQAKREIAAKYLGTRHGQEFTQKNQDAIQNAADTISTLGAFEQRLAETGKTGGVIAGNLPGLVKWANRDFQVLASLSNRLALNNARDMKGSLSDKDVKFLTEIVPSIRNGRSANVAQIQFLRSVARRQQDYAISRQRATENGEGSSFMADWTAFTNAVGVQRGVDFETWRSTRPRFDSNGRPVQ